MQLVLGLTLKSGTSYQTFIHLDAIRCLTRKNMEFQRMGHPMVQKTGGISNLNQVRSENLTWLTW